MAKAKDPEKFLADEKNVTHGGVVIKGKHTVGKRDGTAHDQAKRAQEKEKPDKETADAKEAGAVISKPELPLFSGDLSAEAISSKTGQPISLAFNMPEPGTEEEAKRIFEAHHGVGSIAEGSWKLDVTNTIDPSKRTYLER